MSDWPNVHVALANVMRDLGAVPKGTSRGVQYEYRSIDSVFDALHPLLAKQGLHLEPRVLPDWTVTAIPGTKDRLQYQALFRVEVEVRAADGSSVVLGSGLAQSHDYGDKAAYQAQQNAIKYVLIEAFCMASGEPDMDGRDADPSPVAVGGEATATGDAPAPTTSTPTGKASHPQLLAKLEVLLAQLGDTEDSTRGERLREYAKRGIPEARAAVGRLTKELAKKKPGAAAAAAVADGERTPTQAVAR